MKQLLEALGKIHSHNLIHRDLKSANILFHQGRIYIADVGMMTQHERNKQHDPTLITRWYRAPELLLGKTNYGTEVDMWSIGCILVELITKQTPFPGMNEAHQMDRIFHMIGSPTTQIWGDEVATYPGWKKLRQGLYKTNQIRTIFKDWDNEALDFLEKLWSPPNSRISAIDALKHSFFNSEPLPCSLSSLPRVPSVHEYEVKKRRQHLQGGENKRQRTSAPQQPLPLPLPLPISQATNSYGNGNSKMMHPAIRAPIMQQRVPIANHHPGRTMVTAKRTSSNVGPNTTIDVHP